MNDRKHLVSAEFEKLMVATKGSRNKARDRCLLLLMFRHGLRVSEACSLELSQVDTESRVIHVARLKNGLSTTHPLRGDEIRSIKAWLKERARMRPDGESFFYKRTAFAFEQKDGIVCDQYLWQKSKACPARSSAHAPPRLRFCFGRPGSRHQVNSRLFRPPEHSAHRQIYSHQSGTV